VFLNGTTNNFTNGYVSENTLLIYPDNTASGYQIVTCNSGYYPDPSIGSNCSCNNGIWSARPNCLQSGRCPLSQLHTFLNDPTQTAGLQIVTQQLNTVSDDKNATTQDSYILFNCSNGYTNTGGSYNVSCNANSAWSQPWPFCQSTTTQSPSTLTCPFSLTMLQITNGYAVDTSGLTLVSSGTTMAATPNSVITYTCLSPYTVDPSVGASVTCVNGQWSPSSMPQCILDASPQSVSTESDDSTGNDDGDASTGNDDSDASTGNDDSR